MSDTHHAAMATIPYSHIPPEQWPSFFDEFSRDKLNIPMTVEIDTPELGSHGLAHDLPLVGIIADTEHGAEFTLELILGPSPNGQRSHTIRNPERVALAPFIEEVEVGAIIVATGWQPYDLHRLPEYGGGEIPDVIDLGAGTGRLAAMLARLNGLDLNRLKEIGDYATSPLYSDDERAAIDYADAMTATPTEATDEQVADLERRFGRDGVVELTFQIALENLRSRLNSALGITEQGFNSGNACRVPWAEAEAIRKA